MIAVRPARREDGPAIGTLFRAADWPDGGVDWQAANVAGWWLVAEAEGEVLGALQFMSAEPVGYIAELVLHPRARGLGAPVARQLYITAEAVMVRAGVQRLAATLRADRPGWRRIVRQWGAREHTEPVMLVSKAI